MVTTAVKHAALVLFCLSNSLLPTAIAAADSSAAEIHDNDHLSSKHSAYSVQITSGAELSLKPPELPDLSPYSRQSAEKRFAAVRPARPIISIRRMFGSFELSEFTASDRTREWAKRQLSHPKAIFILAGVAHLDDIVEVLGNSRYFENLGDGVYISRLPIVVSNQATLIINQQVQSLRLSAERGAFLVVDGKLFVFDSELVAWRESDKTPAEYRNKDEFRPFLSAFGGSEIYLYDSSFISLGYETSKSYGISVTQYSAVDNKILRRDDPIAWIVNSLFTDNYFGFYSWEASGLVLLGNVYNDNIVYGIDPHDHSERLIIGNNTIYGTKEKHGLITSRGVNNSWIFNNVSYNNTRSGFLLDRASENNVLYKNVAYDNGGDGFTLYESSDNLLWGNKSYKNSEHGFRFRNSTGSKSYNNDALANGRFGVYSHVSDLSNMRRDLRLDPYTMASSLTLIGGSLMANGRGPLHIDPPLYFKVFDIDMRFPSHRLGIQPSGILRDFHTDILQTLVQAKKAFNLTDTSAR